MLVAVGIPSSDSIASLVLGSAADHAHQRRRLFEEELKARRAETKGERFKDQHFNFILCCEKKKKNMKCIFTGILTECSVFFRCSRFFRVSLFFTLQFIQF